MFGYLMRNRVIFIGSRINDEVRLSAINSAVKHLYQLKTCSHGDCAFDHEMWHAAAGCHKYCS